jgi:small redox-active disulfide protein 2
MMKIQILGTGCSKCKYLFQAAEQAVKESGVSATVEKVTDIAQILEYSPWALPALVIDGQVKTAGQMLSADEIRPLLPGRKVLT